MSNSSDTPILSGFYPDPSICCVDGTFYLATSSFEYRPGVPLFKSTNLVSWTQIGHILTRPSQLPEDDGRGSTGIYAPTLRHHGGRFWMVTTNVTQPGSEQIVCWAEKPEGPWSDTVRTSGCPGIDPDLTWDGDHCYLTWTTSDPDNPAILQVLFDPFTATALEEPRTVWRGTGLAYPEAPHFYQKDGWWYLMLAEGGTERGHCITMARSRSIRGPFDPAPDNPIFSNRSFRHPVQNTGHGDLLRLEDGRWIMTYLGVRPHGTSPGFHVNGRETFVAGVDWSGDWPKIETNAFDFLPDETCFVDDFTSDELHARWVSPGRYPSSFVRSEKDRGLAVNAGDTQAVSILARVKDKHWSAEFEIDLSEGTGAVLIRMDQHHSLAVEFSGGLVQAALYLSGLKLVLGEPSTGAGGHAVVRLTSRPAENDFMSLEGPDVISAFLGIAGQQLPLATIDGRYLSTEVAGGFTGRMIGVRADSGRILIRGVSYSRSGLVANFCA